MDRDSRSRRPTPQRGESASRARREEACWIPETLQGEVVPHGGSLMAEAPEWTEELVAQYHEIQGFLGLRNLPTTTGEGGGRSQADLVAFRPSKGRFKVFDIEVGTYYERTETTVNWIVDKFSSARRDLVTRAVKGLTGRKEY